MRLIRAHFENFKLLEDIKLEFSTKPDQPLTVIRAENGSGKTSILYALLWAFYGMEGLPAKARGLRLTSSWKPAGVPVDVSVMIEFEHTDDNGDTTRYRLLRSVVETPTNGDKVNRPNDMPARLLRITAAGEEDIQGAEALIGKLVPRHLRDVFFTNGDDVQTFISARVSTQQQQDKVHESIKLLLGLDSMRIASDDLEHVYRRFRSDAARAGGSDTTAIESDLEATDTDRSQEQREREKLTERLANMTEQKQTSDKELTAIRGIGDLDDLNIRIDRAKRARDAHEIARNAALKRMREALKSEACSWDLLGVRIDSALTTLSGLADRNIIPGTSIEVLTDRLDLGVCICGEPLTPGSSHAQHVENLRDEQAHTSIRHQRLTMLLHSARQTTDARDARISEGDDFQSRRTMLLKEFTDARDLLATTASEIDELEQRRRQIDDVRVRDLTDKIAKIERQIGDTNIAIGHANFRITQLEARREEQYRRLQDAERAATIGGNLTTKRDIAKELWTLAQNTLSTLENDYVQRVSTRMNELFMRIVGSHPDFEAGVFTGVHIDDSYSIVVDTHGGRRLDTDFELNGASQRALTLAFIWALMEISATTAPRIIDTPLGMVAGGVKTRMVEVITEPAGSELPDFQVILLLTRSEVRDVEDLIDQRAGVVRTLSCSKDYPEDLAYTWRVDHPTTRLCTCNHRQSCRICARRYDTLHSIEFRDEEAFA